MQSAATIYDAARRLEEAAAVFRLKSRSALEEFGELGARWTDSRARRFTLEHIEPQRDWIEQGARLCNLQSGLVDAARLAAEEAERELSAFFAAQSGFESAEESARQSSSAAHDQASRALDDAARARAEVHSISAATSAAAQDPGW